MGIVLFKEEGIEKRKEKNLSYVEKKRKGTKRSNINRKKKRKNTKERKEVPLERQYLAINATQSYLYSKLAPICLQNFLEEPQVRN